MMYHYHDLHDSEFEKLVIFICEEILGAGVQGFAKGPDGGKDGKFNGTANIFPSQNSPWQGKTIIQAKHTTGINKHYLDPDFFSESSEKCILNEEIAKIKNLILNGELDNYILFSNRNFTGGAEPTLKKYIAKNTGLNEFNIAVIGISDLDKWMARYPHIVNMAKLTPLTISPIIKPDTLAEVINGFSEVFDSTQKNKDFNIPNRTKYIKKNELNHCSDAIVQFFNRNYMSYAFQVKIFLEDPQNIEIFENYSEAFEEFQLRFIIPKQKENPSLPFDDIFNDLVELLRNRNYVLSTNTKLTRIMVFYMYWNCDIGRSEDD